MTSRRAASTPHDVTLPYLTGPQPRGHRPGYLSRSTLRERIVVSNTPPASAIATMASTPLEGCTRAEPPNRWGGSGVSAVQSPAELPHILTLANGDGEDAHIWDYAELTCPHHPPTTLMPCAVWVDCGCSAKITNQNWPTGDGPCPRSATGQHHYIDGEPSRPHAECFAEQWSGSAEFCDAAFELNLPPGRYRVRPWWDGVGFRLELIDKQAVTR